MGFPEITALGRQLARSDPRDRDEQALNLARIREAQSFLEGQRAPGLAACLQAAAHLVGALAHHAGPLERDEVHRIARSLIATVEKSAAEAGISSLLMPPTDSDRFAGSSAPDGAERHGAPGTARPRILRGGPSAGRPSAVPAAAARGANAPQPISLTEGANGGPSPGTLRTDLPRLNDMVLGQILVEMGHVGEDDVTHALRHQVRTGQPVGQSLVTLGLTTAELVEDALRLQESLRASLARAGAPEPVAPAASSPPAPTPDASPRDAGPDPSSAGASDEPQESPVARALGMEADALLGEILRRTGAVGATDLALALDAQRGSGRRLGDVLVDQGACGWQQVEEARELQKRLRYVAGLEV